MTGDQMVIKNAARGVDAALAGLRAAGCVEHLRSCVDCGLHTDIVELLVKLQHLCDHYRIEWREVVEMADGYYLDDVDPGFWEQDDSNGVRPEDN
jgi:hypothetical protein